MIGASATPATVAPVTLGYLTCTVSVAEEGGGGPGGEGREGLCQFKPSGNGPEETYVGTLQGTGLAKELFGKGTLILAVLGPQSTGFRAGMLEQDYSADASRAAAAAVPLVGGSDKSLVLQPIAEVEGRVSSGKPLTPRAAIILIELRLKASAA
jgi:hypothetical protein